MSIQNTIKLSPKTLTLLENFEKINSSILIKNGNQIRTIHYNQQLAVVAEVEEVFPIEFFIQDLKYFIKLCKLHMKCLSGLRLEFFDDHIIFDSDFGQSKYNFYEPSKYIKSKLDNLENVKSPQSPYGSYGFKFVLPNGVLEQIQKVLKTTDGYIGFHTRSNMDKISIHIGENYYRNKSKILGFSSHLEKETPKPVDSCTTCGHEDEPDDEIDKRIISTPNVEPVNSFSLQIQNGLFENYKHDHIAIISSYSFGLMLAGSYDVSVGVVKSQTTQSGVSYLSHLVSKDCCLEYLISCEPETTFMMKEEEQVQKAA
jgi:hypothetical protein